MGSQIVVAVAEQKGDLSTNPAGLVPDPSRPIEQVDASPTTPSEPIQQVAELSTAEDASISISRPIEQQGILKFVNPSADKFGDVIQQIKIERLTVVENKDTPIEQQEYVIDDLRDGSGFSRPIDQRDISRDATDPIEQTVKISNTVDLTQFDFSELIFPPCDSIKNPVSTNILWRIRDFGFTFDVETLIFNVDGVQVQDSSEFTVTPLVGGLQLDYNPPVDFDFDTDITVILTISDNAVPPNDFLFNCTWRTVEDSRPPSIDLISPVCDAVNVDVKAPVIVDIIDTGKGVDQDTVIFSIEGLPVCSGVSFSSLTTVSGSGLRLTWNHNDDPFRFDSSVSVSVQATDLSPLENSAFFVCCFQTEESSAPDFFNFDPAECKTFVDPRTGLCFEVYGDVDGVDISTLEVRIDNKLRKVFVRPRLLRSE